MEEERRFYRHFKGGKYELLTIAYDSETVAELVVYRALYGEHKVWVRPKSMFFENVIRDGVEMPRFKEITKSKAFEEE